MNGQRFLQKISEVNNEKEFSLLTDQGDKPPGTTRTTHQKNLLMEAILLNDSALIKRERLLFGDLNYLVEYPDTPIDTRITPLILACHLGRYDLVKMFLDAPNVDLDVDQASDDSQLTPLAIACKSGNYDIMKLLLDHRAGANLPNAFNQVPLVFCFGRLEEASNVFENRRLAFKMADLLIEFGADVNWIVDKDKGYTMLMQYCSIKHELDEREKETNKAVIKFLLSRGASKELTSLKKGKSIYEITKKHCCATEIIELLDSVEVSTATTLPNSTRGTFEGNCGKFGGVLKPITSKWNNQANVAFPNVNSPRAKLLSSDAKRKNNILDLFSAMCNK